jgi:hypothetical protein
MLNFVVGGRWSESATTKKQSTMFQYHIPFRSHKNRLFAPLPFCAWRAKMQRGVGTERKNSTLQEDFIPFQQRGNF